MTRRDFQGRGLRVSPCGWGGNIVYTLVFLKRLFRSFLNQINQENYYFSEISRKINKVYLIRTNFCAYLFTEIKLVKIIIWNLRH